MKTLASLKTDHKQEALKYAYAFMKSQTVNSKELLFFHSMPHGKDTYPTISEEIISASYKRKVPNWEKFIKNPEHLNSFGFKCVGFVDARVEKRVILMCIDDIILFHYFGNYEMEAEEAFQEISLLHFIF